jgi:hypothetical protein
VLLNVCTSSITSFNCNGTVINGPQTSPDLVSGVIIVYIIDKKGVTTGMIWSFNYLNIQMKMSRHAHWNFIYINLLILILPFHVVNINLFELLMSYL